MPLLAQAQKEGNIWYFGYNAGIDFNKGAPVARTDGQLNTLEGCATISDHNGNLLFYTDGVQVWDRRHKVMLGGGYLWGDPSSTQSAIIVPMPGDTSQYYIFTADQLGHSNGINCVIVDMTGNKGYGLVKFGQRMFSPSTEKLSCTPTADYKGYWLIAHGWGNNQFYAYKIDKSGIKGAVVSRAGTTVSDRVLSDAIGYMVVSPNGHKLGMANWGQQLLELFDFDNATGRVSNPLTLSTECSYYGVAFSADSRMLYATHLPQSDFDLSNTRIHQFDLTAKDIPASIYHLKTDDSTSFGAIQLGPDAKLYISRNNAHYLDIIQTPEKQGAACGYKHIGVSLKYPTAAEGLPNILPYFLSKGLISYNAGCYSQHIDFTAMLGGHIDSLKWDFGDPASGNNNRSSATVVSHLYKDTGTYKVVLSTYFYGHFAQDSAILRLYGPPKFGFGPDTTICKGALLPMHGTAPFDSFRFSDGRYYPSDFTIDTAGRYWVNAWKKGCKQSDTINVNIWPTIVHHIIVTSLCKGKVLSIDYSQPACQYQWQDGNKTAARTIKEAGLYTLKVNNLCESITDSITLHIINALPARLGNDTFLCPGHSFSLSGPDSCTYLWQDGSTDRAIMVNKPGNYSLTAANGCGKTTDSVKVRWYPDIKQLRAMDTAICAGSTIALNYDMPGCSFRWMDGYNKPFRKISNQGLYYIIITSPCKSAADTIKVRSEYPLHPYLGRDTVLCKGDSMKLRAPAGMAHIWPDGSRKDIYTVHSPGNYIITAYNSCGIARDTINVDYIPKYSSHLPADTILCLEDELAVNAYSAPGAYRWSNGTTGPKLNLKGPTQYILYFQSACQKVQDTINVGADSFCQCHLYAPDIFTPDNDGLNDSWKPSECSRYRAYYLQIYNRWGERVFESDKLEKGWDGQFKSSPAMEGMYRYMITMSDVHNKKSYQNGRLYLVRH